MTDLMGLKIRGQAMLYKSFDAAKATLAGIEMVNMLRKGQDFLGRLFVQNHIQAFHDLAII